MSSVVPKLRQPVGQALMHAGSRPTATRSTQRVHFAILPVFAENFGTSNGQPVEQYLQPMHFSGSTSTMPFEYCTIAPGAGHASRHPGSAQCVQPSLRISHSRSPLGFSYSVKRINVQDSPLRSPGLSYTPTLLPMSSRRSFHSMQAS